jgi:hypothetical protein
VKLFADETDLLLFPPLRAEWFLRGKPADVPISGENAKRTVFGVVDVETGELVRGSSTGSRRIALAWEAWPGSGR